MWQIVLLIHVLVAVSLIGLVLLQHGKGADIGAAFGSGASQTVFGSQGSGSFLSKVTLGLAGLFFATSLTLGYLASHEMKQSQQVVLPVAPTTQIQTTAPAAPASQPETVQQPAAPATTPKGNK